MSHVMSHNGLRINMREYGVNGPVSRVIGAKIAEEAIELYQHSPYEFIILDFSDVEYVTSGFVTDLLLVFYRHFGPEFKDRIRFYTGQRDGILKSTLMRGLMSVVRK